MSRKKRFNPEGKGFSTQALHTGVTIGGERDNSIPIHLTSSYAFDDAEYARAVFAEEVEGNIYSRFTNPSVTAFEKRLAALEGAEHALATSSGMAAISAVFLSLLSAGDHLVISRSVFGSTLNVADILKRYGIEVTPVELSNLNAWKEAIRPNTKLLFAETPANPTLELGDLSALAEIAHDAGARLCVDNVFCTPVLQQPLALGADLVIQSATKYIDGQGRVLGGAILGNKALLTGTIFPFLRNTGPTLSAFNAWVLFKGMETLPLRIEKQCDTTAFIVEALARNETIRDRLRYPGLDTHPQHQLASQQMNRFGALFCLILDGKEQAHRFIDSLELAIVTANLGDVRTLVTHPATTTHSRLTQQQRHDAGVTDGLVRFSIGLEDQEDILEDVEQALKAAGVT
ncbi:MAG: O-succinylhomoserine sulfhydrylase [Magnetococcales bacterium]|nr:O-succinylhomoserine sulfhydrylase [Magnetococcales bacterium]